MTAPADAARYQRAAHVLWRQFEGGVLLLRAEPSVADVTAHDPTLVSGIGSLLWQLLAEPHTLDELVTAVRDATAPSAPDEATVRTDIAAVLADLETADLVVRAHAA